MEVLDVPLASFNGIVESRFAAAGEVGVSILGAPLRANWNSSSELVNNSPNFPRNSACFPPWEMLSALMRLIARSTLAAFGERHPEAKASLHHWISVARAAAWWDTADVQAGFSKAKVLNGERVRFEVAGGDYRMVVAFDFRRSIAFVKFIGTHAEYDRIDALTGSEF